MALLTVEELAKKISVSKSTIYNWRMQKRIPYVKMGKLIRFDTTEIDRWVNEQKKEAVV